MILLGFITPDYLTCTQGDIKKPPYFLICKSVRKLFNLFKVILIRQNYILKIKLDRIMDIKFSKLDKIVIDFLVI